MGKSKGRVPIKGGSKKVRKIKNVQEGGRNIGSDRKMDVDMTNLLHLFKYIVDKKKGEEELERAAQKEPTVNIVDELKKNLAKLFYFLGGDISIILLRQKGRLKIDENSVDKSYDKEKAEGYKNAMEKLGFDMNEMLDEEEEAGEKKGVLEIARFKGNLPDVPDMVKKPGKITFPQMIFDSGQTTENFNENWDKQMQLDLGETPAITAIVNNNITISKNLHKVLGIPGDFKETEEKITVHIDIFNEYRLPILHHILNLRIHLQEISDEDKLNEFFYKEVQENKKKAILLSVASGRFLNATGYHIKPEKKLTRFKIEPGNATDETMVKELLIKDNMLDLFQESGKTEKDKAADEEKVAAGEAATKRLKAAAEEGREQTVPGPEP